MNISTGNVHETTAIITSRIDAFHRVVKQQIESIQIARTANNMEWRPTIFISQKRIRFCF